MTFAIERQPIGEVVSFTVRTDRIEWGYNPQSVAIYPAIVTPPPVGDWTGTDEDGYTSTKHKARVMSLGRGAEWWAMMDDRWLNDEDGGPLAFPSARMAREQVERRREAERG